MVVKLSSTQHQDPIEIDLTVSVSVDYDEVDRNRCVSDILNQLYMYNYVILPQIITIIINYTSTMIFFFSLTKKKYSDDAMEALLRYTNR